METNRQPGPSSIKLKSMATVAVSSWALHRTLGVSYPDSPATGPRSPESHSDRTLPLLDLPAAVAKAGFARLELCHFHVPSKDPAFLRELKDRFAEAGVTLQTLLIDDGDPSHPEHAARDAAWIADWIDVAGRLGAERVRVIAGKQPYSSEAMDRAVAHLGELAARGVDQNVRVATENWFALLSAPGPVNELLDRLKGTVGLCADFGNWDRSYKYEALPQILPLAETIHAKCDFDEDFNLDEEDFARCLDLARKAEFDGPYVLVNGGPEDEWEALRRSREAVEGVSGKS